MRPSNMFEDITESQFRQRETLKNNYRLDLVRQMDQASHKRDEEKRRKKIEDIEEERRILQELGLSES